MFLYAIPGLIAVFFFDYRFPTIIIGFVAIVAITIAIDAQKMKKIEQLNIIAQLIKDSPQKRTELSSCKNHEEVINLTTKWGFEIGKRWGE